MIIRFENFLCYENKTFNFETENGSLVLISGPSGIGKTSIFRGIFFAIFGKGKNLYKKGQKSCKVTLKLDDISICRTKNPNRLIVNSEYEDEIGQSIIDKKFGEAFQTCSYIPQNNISSFILLSPIEKFAFLEKFCFENVNVSNIKSKIKEKCKKLEKDLLKVTSELEITSEILKSQEVIEKPLFPIKSSKKQREIIEKNQTILIKNNDKILRKLNRQILRNEKEKNKITVLNTFISVKEDRKVVVKSKIDNLNKCIENSEYIGDESLEKLKEKLNRILKEEKYYNTQKKVIELKNKANKIEKEEKEYLRQSIEKINSNLWKEYEENEIIELLDDLKSCLEDGKRVYILQERLKTYDLDEDEITGLKRNITNLEDEYTRLYEKIEDMHCYTCPNCNINLKLENKKLYIHVKNSIDEEINESIDACMDRMNNIKNEQTKLSEEIKQAEEKLNKAFDLKQEINTIREKYETIPVINEIKNDISYLENYYTEQKHFLKQKAEFQNKLNNNILSITYSNFIKEIKTMEEYLVNEKITDYISENKEDIEEEILMNENRKQEQYRNVKLKQELEKELFDIDKIIEEKTNEHIEKYNTVRNIESIESDISRFSYEIKEANEKIKESEENINKINIWKEKDKLYQKYIDIKNTVRELGKKEEHIKKYYNASLELQTIVLKTESISLLSIIESINNHSSIYLEHFFPNEPISVQLTPFKETKTKTKYQINVKILYKGIDMDLSMLSGGELSRVVLAYTLALSEIFNSPLLLLDECTASLNEDLANVIFDYIKSNFCNKTILVIAHQVVNGVFDNIISLKN